MKKIDYKIKEDFEHIIDREKIDGNIIRKMPNFATLPYNSSLLKLGDNLQGTLENIGYTVEKDSVNSNVGSHGEQIQELNISFFGRKRRDFQGKVGESRSLKPLWISLVGLVLFSIGLIFKNLGVNILAVLIIGGGVYICIKAPKILTYSYIPLELGVWILGSGHGIQGTKRHELKEGSKGRSHAKRYIESAYIQAEANLKVGANHEKVDGYYTERILLNQERQDVTLFDLIKGLFQKKDKITFQDESKYNKLPKDEKEVEKDLGNDFKELKESLKKFS